MTPKKLKYYLKIAKENALKDPHYVRDMERALDFLEAELVEIKKAVKAADQSPS